MREWLFSSEKKKKKTCSQDTAYQGGAVYAFKESCVGCFSGFGEKITTAILFNSFFKKFSFDKSLEYCRLPRVGAISTFQKKFTHEKKISGFFF